MFVQVEFFIIYKLIRRNNLLLEDYFDSSTSENVNDPFPESLQSHNQLPAIEPTDSENETNETLGQN